MAKTFDSEQKQINILGAGTIITGDIKCSGDIRIDGSLVGNLSAQGRVVIGTSGSVKGEVTCRNSEIEGKIEGKIEVAELLSLKTTSSILGDIITKKMAVEPGAVFTGNCKMDNNAASTFATKQVDDKKK